MSRINDRLPYANQRFDLRSDACPPDTFAVVRMQGFEAISRPYRFELVLASDDAHLDLAAVLAAGAHLAIRAPDDATASTPYAGMLAEFDQLHQAGGFTFYRAVLVPRLWQLSLCRGSEVYLHEQTIPEIIEGILKSARLHPGRDYEMRLTGSYRPRSYVCQYQETPLAFISRWMEKEGIYYHFEQVDGRDRMVLLDARTAQADGALAVNYRPADELDTGLARDSVQAFVCRTRPLPRRVVMQDFNHRRAGLPLVVSAEVSDSGMGEEMIYGENFRTPEEGERYARLRAQELLCGARSFNAEATAVGLRAGAFMDLAHHYRRDFDGRYLVTEITHEGSQAGALLAGLKTPYGEREGQITYRNTFRALPADVQFRPARTTPKPRVAGTMNATIDAEGSGELAELDRFGQYKVQLPFDRTDKAAGKGSARVRMATPYSGNDHGMHFPLHKNAEVLLAFTDGDPDQPTIVGAVPNSTNANVVTGLNASDNRIATKGGNQIYMGDAKGKEVTWLHSPFHNSSIALGSIDPKGGGSLGYFTAGSSEAITIGNKAELTVGAKNEVSFGMETAISAGFSNKLSVGTAFDLSWQGDAKWTLPGARSWSIDDSDNTQLHVKKEEMAQESIHFSAGTAPTSLVSEKALEKLKGRVKEAVAGMIATNVVIGSICTGVLAKDKTHEQDWAEDGKPNPWAIGTSVTNIGANLLSSIAGIAILRHHMTKFAEAQAKLTYASDLKLDKDGIVATINDSASDGRLGMHAGRIELISGPPGMNSAMAPNPNVPVLAFMPAKDKSALVASKGSLDLHGGVYTQLGGGHIQGPHGYKASLKLDDSGISAQASDGELKGVAKVIRFMTAHQDSGFNMDERSAGVFSGSGEMQITRPGDISLKAASGAGMTLDKDGIKLSTLSGVKIDGKANLALNSDGLITLG